MYRDLQQPVFGEQFHIDGGNKDKNWTAMTLNKKQKDFFTIWIGFCAFVLVQ